jgi:hypothetical protein
MTESPEHVPGEPGEADVDAVLRDTVREIEAHAAEAGWDQPARLYALVPTADLVAREPRLAQAMGLDSVRREGPGSLTPVEQDHVPVEQALEDVLGGIVWPAEVFGAAAVVERLVLPPTAEGTMPEDEQEALAWLAAHPERQEVRLAVGVLRDGTAECALRMRAHDVEDSVLVGPQLVPGLVEALRSTLAD